MRIQLASNYRIVPTSLVAHLESGWHDGFRCRIDEPQNKAIDLETDYISVEEAETLGLRAIRMPSGAGHDAQNLESICPSGMIFVPSRDGISHSPYEYTTDMDCVYGVNTVLQSVLNLAGMRSGLP
jgi:acetylornithine deacetylase/succinyl-diaminopimelate desuccinylase-like protein